MVTKHKNPTKKRYILKLCLPMVKKKKKLSLQEFANVYKHKIYYNFLIIFKFNTIRNLIVKTIFKMYYFISSSSSYLNGKLLSWINKHKVKP